MLCCQKILMDKRRRNGICRPQSDLPACLWLGQDKARGKSVRERCFERAQIRPCSQRSCGKQKLQIGHIGRDT